MAEDPGGTGTAMSRRARRLGPARPAAVRARSRRPVRSCAFALAVLAAFLSVEAQQEASPCQALVEAGANAAEVRQCYIIQTQRQPSDPAAWMALGTDFHTDGETAEAATAYRNVIQIAPDSDLAAKAYLHLGVIFHSQGEMDEALDAYRDSVALRPDPNTLLNMGSILYQRGDHAEALESCERAIEVSPEYFAAYAQMAIIQQNSGDILQAIATYSKAIELKPDYGPAYFNLGTAYEHNGDLPKAIEQFQTAILLVSEPAGPETAPGKFHSRLAAALVEAGQVEREISQHHDVSRHCRPVGSSCKHEQHSLGVLRDLDPSFYYNVGMVYLDTYLEFQPVQVLLDWASSIFKKAVDLAEKEGSPYHGALYALAAAQELKGHTGEALELYSRALANRPESALYSRAVKRAQQALAGSGGLRVKSGLGPGFGGDSTLYARVDDEAVEVVDRYIAQQLIPILRSDAVTNNPTPLNPIP